MGRTGTCNMALRRERAKEGRLSMAEVVEMKLVRIETELEGIG